MTLTILVKDGNGIITRLMRENLVLHFVCGALLTATVMLCGNCIDYAKSIEDLERKLKKNGDKGVK